MGGGWIKLHRSIMDWEWYKDSAAFHLFLHLLIEANHDDQEWFGSVIKRGQLVTSIRSLSRDTGISEKVIRNRLTRFENTGEISRRTTNKNTIISIVNYHRYQSSDSREDQRYSKPKKPNIGIGKDDRYIDDGNLERLPLDSGQIVSIPTYAIKAKKDILANSQAIKLIVERLSAEMLIDKELVDTIEFDIRLKYTDLFIMHALSNNEIEGKNPESVVSHFTNWIVSRFRYRKKTLNNNSYEKGGGYNSDSQKRKQEILLGYAKAISQSSEQDDSSTW